MCKVTRQNLVERLDAIAAERSVAPGPALSPPAPQCVPPAARPEDLVLHATARYLDKEGNPLKARGDYHACPAEEWVVLTGEEAKAFLPSGGRREWDVDPAVARKLLVHFYPVTGNWDPAPKVSRVLEHTLRARLVARHATVAWVRLDGGVRVKHAFYPNKDDDNVADAAVVGFAEVDPVAGRVRALRLVTEGGLYGSRREPFGVAVRSAP
jgi:hypothetical protein